MSTPIENPRAQILLYGWEESERIDQVWLKACHLLKRNLNENGSPTLLGIFSEVNCINPHSADKKRSLSQEYPWTIEVHRAKEISQITIYFQADQKQSRREESKLVIKHSSDLLGILLDSEKSQLIATKLLDQLPIRYRFNTKTIPRNFVLNSNRHHEAPRELMIYSLKFSQSLGIWIPRVVAYAQLRSNAQESSEGKRNRYILTPHRNMVGIGHHLWVHDIGGRKKASEIDLSDRSAKVNEDVEDQKEIEIMDFFLHSLSSSHAGIRYGYPLLKGNNLFAKSSLIGVFAELRSGPIKGLRWAWDLAPKVEETVENKSHGLSWNRASLGWNFSLSPPQAVNKWISNLTVYPSVGLLDFNAQIPLFDANDNFVTTADFTAKNSLDLGIEFGIEKDFKWTTLRIWLGSSLSGIIPMPNTDVEVSGLKIGVDSYYFLYTFPWGIHTSALLFSNFERKTLERRKGLPSDPNDPAIKGLTFDLFFAGFGLALLW